MKVYLLRERATPQQIAEMLEELKTYIPRQGNRSMVIQNQELCLRIEKIVRSIFGGNEE